MRDEVYARIQMFRGMQRGKLRTDPVERLAYLVGPDGGNQGEFLQWSDSPITSLLKQVLRDLSINPPAAVTDASLQVQYGVTLGLQLAEAVLDDPTVLFPELFVNPEVNEPLPSTYDEEYEHV